MAKPSLHPKGKHLEEGTDAVMDRCDWGKQSQVTLDIASATGAVKLLFAMIIKTEEGLAWAGHGSQLQYGKHAMMDGPHQAFW